MRYPVLLKPLLRRFLPASLCTTSLELVPLVTQGLDTLTSKSCAFGDGRALEVLHVASGGVGPTLCLLPVDGEEGAFADEHSQCVQEMCSLVIKLDGGSRELHLLPMTSINPDTGAPSPVSWGFIISPGTLTVTKRLLSSLRVALVLDLDETLVHALQYERFDERLMTCEQQRRALATGTAHLQQEVRARMQALDCEEALLRHDQQLLRQFIEQDCVYMNGVQHDARHENARNDDNSLITRPVIRLGADMVFTRLDPSNTGTSMIIRIRPGWERLGRFLAGAEDGKKRFEVYVCTKARRDYALEAWRLLDPDGLIIPHEQRSTRIVNVTGNKSLHGTLGWPQGAQASPLAMVVDDKPHVWGTDAPHVLRVEPFTYYPEQAARQTGINVEEAVLAEQELDRVRETITKTRCDFYEAMRPLDALVRRLHTEGGLPNADRYHMLGALLPRLPTIPSLLQAHRGNAAPRDPRPQPLPARQGLPAIPPPAPPPANPQDPHAQQQPPPVAGLQALPPPAPQVQAASLPAPPVAVSRDPRLRARADAARASMAGAPHGVPTSGPAQPTSAHDTVHPGALVVPVPPQQPDVEPDEQLETAAQGLATQLPPSAIVAQQRPIALTPAHGLPAPQPAPPKPEPRRVAPAPGQPSQHVSGQPAAQALAPAKGQLTPLPPSRFQPARVVPRHGHGLSVQRVGASDAQVRPQERTRSLAERLRRRPGPTEPAAGPAQAQSASEPAAQTAHDAPTTGCCPSVLQRIQRRAGPEAYAHSAANCMRSATEVSAPVGSGQPKVPTARHAHKVPCALEAEHGVASDVDDPYGALLQHLMQRPLMGGQTAPMHTVGQTAQTQTGVQTAPMHTVVGQTVPMQRWTVRGVGRTRTVRAHVQSPGVAEPMGITAVEGPDTGPEAGGPPTPPMVVKPEPAHAEPLGTGAGVHGAGAMVIKREPEHAGPTGAESGLAHTAGPAVQLRTRGSQGQEFTLSVPEAGDLHMGSERDVGAAQADRKRSVPAQSPAAKRPRTEQQGNEVSGPDQPGGMPLPGRIAVPAEEIEHGMEEDGMQDGMAEDDMQGGSMQGDGMRGDRVEEDGMQDGLALSTEGMEEEWPVAYGNTDSDTSVTIAHVELEEPSVHTPATQSGNDDMSIGSDDSADEASPGDNNAAEHAMQGPDTLGSFAPDNLPPEALPHDLLYAHDIISKAWPILTRGHRTLDAAPLVLLKTAVSLAVFDCMYAHQEDELYLQKPLSACHDLPQGYKELITLAQSVARVLTQPLPSTESQEVTPQEADDRLRAFLACSPPTAQEGATDGQGAGLDVYRVAQVVCDAWQLVHRLRGASLFESHTWCEVMVGCVKECQEVASALVRVLPVLLY